MKFISSLWLAVLLSVVGGAALAQTQDERVKEQQQRAVTQPGNNAPVWREVRQGQSPYTNSSVQGRETNVLVQSWGETWRQIRNGPVTFYGGWLVVLVLLAILAFYFTFGPVKLHERPTGRLIRRFSTVDQVVHWSVAISFCVLGISGLIMFFGKHVLLPIIGYTLFSMLATASKFLHNFIGPLLCVLLPLMILLFVHENLFRKGDLHWLKKGGGMLTGEHVPSGKANAGQKILFWVMVVVCGLTLVVTGLILDFPNFNQTRATMQAANVVHMVAGLIATILLAGHIYLGTIGMKGAWEAMTTGYVDETWAREHHEYWYNEVKSGRAAAEGAPPTAAHRVA
jgi:formate dehydrogenase subunit gamma